MNFSTRITKDRLLLVLMFLLYLSSLYFAFNIGSSAVRMPYSYVIWMVALVIITAGIFILSRSKNVVLPRYWIGLSALPLGLLLSGVLSDIDRPTDWAVRIGYVLGGFLFLYALFQYRPKRKAIEGLLFIVVLAGIGHSLAQLAQIYQLDWLSDWVPIKKGNYGGIFQQVNLLASFTATGVVTTLYLLTVPGFQGRSFVYKLTLYASVALCTAVVLSTGSRAGFLGLGLGMALLFIARFRFIYRHRKQLGFLIAALFMGIAYGLHLSDGLAKLEQKVQREGYENSRIVVYKLSWELFTEKPVMGHGLGSFKRVFQEKRIPFQQQHPDAHSLNTIYSHPHNEILFWLVESGIISVIGMLVASVVTIIQLFRVGWRRGIAYLALILPISLHVMVELPFYLSPIHWFTWLLLLYLIHSHFVIEYRNKLSLVARKTLPAVTLVIAFLLAGLFVHALYSLRNMIDFLNSGGREIGKLESLSNNPILGEVGMRLTMSALLNEDIRNDRFVYTERYIRWTEQYAAQVPSPEILGELSLAYAYIGDHENARRVIDYAHGIYNKSDYIFKRKIHIHAGTLVDLYKQRLSGKKNKP